MINPSERAIQKNPALCRVFLYGVFGVVRAFCSTNFTRRSLDIATYSEPKGSKQPLGWLSQSFPLRVAENFTKISAKAHHPKRVGLYIERSVLHRQVPIAGSKKGSRRSLNRLAIQVYFLRFRPTKPTKAEPKSQALTGRGTSIPKPVPLVPALTPVMD